MNWLREYWTNLLWFTVVAGAGGWFFFYAFRRSTERLKLSIRWGVTAAVLWVIFKIVVPGFARGGQESLDALMTMLVCGGALAVTWRDSLTELFANPITSLYDGGSEPLENKPLYSTAISRRKRGNYHEAIDEIEKQLVKFPYDFEGTMLLAAIQAEDLKDLPAAEYILDEFCAQPKAPEKYVATAWTTLADWYLKIGLDVDSARASLQKIINQYPETDLARRAGQRVAHLVGTSELLQAQADSTPVAVPVGVKNLGLMDSPDFWKPQEIEPESLAAAYVRHLEAHPHDWEAREKLAVIYAKDFQRLDLATLELQQLINETGHKPKQIAGWLNQLADFQVALGTDIETVRSTLETIITRFPKLPVADVAQRRLALLKSEFKGLTETPRVKLGVYEQNIGLKYGSPRKL